jgi:hypothetical protein
MAQDRPRAARQDAGEEAALGSEHAMAHRVDAAMDGVEAAARDAAVDGVLADAVVSELVARDDAVLAAGQIGDRPVGARRDAASGVHRENVPADALRVARARHQFGAGIVPNVPRSVGRGAARSASDDFAAHTAVTASNPHATATAGEGFDANAADSAANASNPRDRDPPRRVRRGRRG